MYQMEYNHHDPLCYLNYNLALQIENSVDGWDLLTPVPPSGGGHPSLVCVDVTQRVKLCEQFGVHSIMGGC